MTDGRSISFNHFDLLQDIAQDYLEKVIWAESCSDTLQQLVCHRRTRWGGGQGGTCPPSLVRNMN